MSNQPYPVIFNAEIESADIRFDRGFILSCWVHLKWEGNAQGFGGYALGGSPFDKDAACARHAEQKNFAADFIGGVLAVAGVDSFAKLPGKIVRVGKADDFGAILAIGHATKDRWYNPDQRLSAFRTEATDA